MAKRYGELVQDLWTGHSKSITPLKFRVRGREGGREGEGEGGRGRGRGREGGRGRGRGREGGRGRGREGEGEREREREGEGEGGRGREGERERERGRERERERERERGRVLISMCSLPAVHCGEVCSKVQWLPAARCSGAAGLCAGWTARGPEQV